MLTKDEHKLLRPWHFAAISTFVLVVLCPPELRAQTPTYTGSFQARLSEKEQMLTDPNAATIRYLQSDTNFQRKVSLSTPFVELTNDSLDDSILEFRMTIGDERFNFSNMFLGDYALIGKTTSGIEIDPSIVEDGNELIIAFPNGLLAGETVRFRIDLDPDDPDEFGTSYPDYRTVLFNSANMAMVQATYDIDTLSVESDWVPFMISSTELEVVEAGSVASAGGCCCSFGGGATAGRGGQPLYNPEYTVATGGGSPAAPEPGSVVLSLIALLGGLGVSRQQRLSHGRLS
jgi:hypothetical protein